MNRNHLLIIFLFLFANSFSQSVETINTNLKIPNILDQSKEIRIYKNFSTTNASEIFRMFKNEKNIWSVELYKYYDAVPSKSEVHFESKKLKSRTNLDLVWLNILNSNIEFLPSIDKIDYKLKSKGEIVLDRGQYDLLWKKTTPLDGIGYKAFYKYNLKTNSFDFGNFERYIKEYPEVDELIFYEQIIDIIKKEFDLWKE